MENKGADGSLNLSSERATSSAHKFQRFRKGCGCATAAMAVIFLVVFFAVLSSSLRDIRQTIEVDGRVQNVWQSEEKDLSGVLRLGQKAVVRYRFGGEDYTAQVTPEDRVLEIGDQVRVYINPKSPNQAELRKLTVADLVGSVLMVGAVFLLVPLVVSYGIYWWLGKVQVKAYLGQTPLPDRVCFGKTSHGEISEHGTVGFPRPATAVPSADLREIIRSWLIDVSPILLVIALVGVSPFMGWNISSFHSLLALIAVIVLQNLIRRRRKKMAARVEAVKTRAEVRLPDSSPSQPPLRLAWPWSENPHPWLIGAGVAFLLSGAVFGYISVQGKLRGDRILAGEKVKGKVIEVVRVPDESSSLLYHCYPVVNYTFDGKVFQYQSRRDFLDGGIQEGDYVALLVNPKNPQEAAIDTSDQRDTYHHVTWVLPLMFAVFGWAVLRKGLAMRRERPTVPGPAS